MRMKIYVRRFVDWMEGGPSILTIWFLPILLIIAAYAVIKNKFTKGT
jgi:hypothetical protein